MKISKKFFSLPPYISTSWSNIRALHMKGNALVVTLVDGDTINIPNLAPEAIESIFNAHTLFLETESPLEQFPLPNQISTPLSSHPQPLSNNQIGELPFRLGFGPIDGLATALQHNPAQANAPDLPKEMLQKIGAIAKIITPDDVNALPKAEPHCNCIHCQITRAIHQGLHPQETIMHHPDSHSDEPIAAEDLQFQQWEISQTGDKLFSVVNKLDTQEKYSVYLGHPVGCTCGKADCEHILAVLKS